MQRRFLASLRAPMILPLLLVCFSLTLTGCGKKKLSTYPVSGEVFVDGKPAVGAEVIFYPVNDPTPQAYPAATVGTDGSFHVTTYSMNDGAPPGDYTITIVWAETKKEPGEDPIVGPDKLKGQYSTPTRSTLKATIQKAKTQLPRYDLK